MNPFPAPLAISAIGQIAIPATLMTRAQRFYRDVLGLHFLFDDKVKLAFFDCDGVRLMIDASGGSARQAASIIYFRVADIDAAFLRLAQHDTRIVSQPHLVARLPDHELWIGFFQDSEGNTMALMEERRPTA